MHFGKWCSKQGYGRALRAPLTMRLPGKPCFCRTAQCQPPFHVLLPMIPCLSASISSMYFEGSIFFWSVLSPIAPNCKHMTEQNISTTKWNWILAKEPGFCELRGNDVGEQFKAYLMPLTNEVLGELTYLRAEENLSGDKGYMDSPDKEVLNLQRIRAGSGKISGVCVYMCVCVCIYNHTHVYTYVCIFIYIIVYVCAQLFSCVQLFVTPRTVACQAPLSSTLGVEHAVDLDKCIMVCIHHYSCIHSNLYKSPLWSTSSSPDSHWFFFYCLHSFAFSTISYSWNPMLFSFFKLASFT